MSREDFSPSSTRFDQASTAIEGTGETSRAVPIVLHPALVDSDEITDEQRRALLIKITALRVICGLEPRSLRALAEELGCRHTAIDNAVRRICERIGVSRYGMRTKCSA